MCFKPARMGMISSRQRVLRGMSKMAVQPSRSWGSKGLRMRKSFEEGTAGNAELGGNRHFPRIDTENPSDLRDCSNKGDDSGPESGAFPSDSRRLAKLSNTHPCCQSQEPQDCRTPWKRSEILRR